MPCFAGHDSWRSTGKIAGDAKPGARRDHRHGVAHDGPTFAHGNHVVGAEVRDRPGQGLEIVHEIDRLKTQRLPQAFGIERPGGVGEFAATARDGPGRGDHRAIHDGALRLAVQEVMRGIVQASIGAGTKRLDGPQPPVSQQGEAGARAPDIGEETIHGTPPRTCAAMVALYQRAEALGMRCCVG